MRLHTLEDMPNFEVTRTYKANTWLGMLLITGIMLALTLFVAVPKADSTPPLVVAMPALLTLLFFMVFLSHLRLCLASGNWLLKECPEGLLLNLRSFRNAHLPNDTPTVLFLPAESIAGVGKTLEHRTLPFHWMREKSQFAHLDLYLREGVDTRPLHAALHTERRCTNPASWRHRYTDCPVQMAETGVIRLVWDWIHPREDKALSLLGERFGVAPKRTLKSPPWDTLTDAEKDALIDRLWEQGHEERAYMLAAHHYKIHEKRARKLVHERNFQRTWDEEEAAHV